MFNLKQFQGFDVPDAGTDLHIAPLVGQHQPGTLWGHDLA